MKQCGDESATAYGLVLKPIQVSSNCNRIKRRKKKEEKSCFGLLWLPEHLTLSIMARISRSDHAALATASNALRPLVTSPELLITRSLMGCTEPTLYVCLRVHHNPIPRWFTLTRDGQLSRPIVSNLNQATKSSSFVVVDSGIYVIGGVDNRGGMSCDVWFFNCFSHTWTQLPSMKIARASASACFVDGKIYVFGGLLKGFTTTCAEVFDTKSQTWELLIIRKICDDFHQSVVVEGKKIYAVEEDNDNDAVKIFDTKTQTWRNLFTPKMSYNFEQSVVIQGNKVYAVDEEGQSFYFSPREGMFWRMGRIDSMPGKRQDWCAIGNLLFCRGSGTNILWCEPDKLDWEEVKGLEELKPPPSTLFYNLKKLTSNTDGNLVIFWTVRTLQQQDSHILELWSTEISLEKREGDNIWGKIERSGALIKHAINSSGSDLFTVDVLFSGSVFV